jgi:predicted phosphodiesterase
VNEIRSIEDACAQVKVDPSDYIIQQIDLKPNQQGQKGPDGKPVVLQLFSAHWRLLPKTPESFLLKPVSITLPKPPPRQPAPPRESKRAVVFGDMHFGFRRERSGKLEPFHDLAALDILHTVVRETNPDVVVCLGDGMDWPEMTTRWLLRPEHDNTMQPALNAMAKYFGLLRRAAPDAEFVYIEGNHEKRLWENLLNGPSRPLLHIHQAGDEEQTPILTLPHLADFKTLGVRYEGTYPESSYPRGRYWLNDNLLLVHGMKASRAPGSTAKNYLDGSDNSVLFGHTHRAEAIYRTYHGPDHLRVRSAQSFGCMCRIDGIVPSATDEERWQQGFGLVDYLPGNGRFGVTPVLIHDGVAMFDGYEYHGDASRMGGALSDTE